MSVRNARNARNERQGTMKILDTHEAILQALSLAIVKGYGLSNHCDEESLTVKQLELVKEAVTARINRDFRRILKAGQFLIAETVPAEYETYSDGIISQKELFEAYLHSLTLSDCSECREDAESLKRMLSKISAKIKNPNSYW